MRIQNKQPSTFYTKASPLYVADDKGRIFYCHENGARDLTFNLPVGNYTTNQNVERKPNFEPYPVLVLPAKEQIFDSRNFGIKIDYNPHKGTFRPSQELIILDKDVVKYPYKPYRYFVLAHEKGHSYFSDESKCDWYALNWCLQNGFNPLQIQSSYKRLLKNHPDRIEFLNDKLTQLNYVR